MWFRMLLTGSYDKWFWPVCIYMLAENQDLCGMMKGFLGKNKYKGRPLLAFIVFLDCFTISFGFFVLKLLLLLIPTPFSS